MRSNLEQVDQPTRFVGKETEPTETKQMWYTTHNEIFFLATDD
jgi:hypothetical protein